jgi:hypothetical protein
MSGTRNPSLAQLYGRIGGLRARSRHDPLEYTAAARRAFLAGFEDQVDPYRVLPPEERKARAEAAKKAHMAELAYRSAVVRAGRARQRASAGASKAAAEPNEADHAGC